MQAGIKEHLQARFLVCGVIQTYFLMCEVSKGVHDLYTAASPAYVPTSPDMMREAMRKEQSDSILDADVNSRSMLCLKFSGVVVRCMHRWPYLWALSAVWGRRLQNRELQDLKPAITK